MKYMRIMKKIDASAVIQRLSVASGVKNIAELASILNVSVQAIYYAKKKNHIPPAWSITVAQLYNASIDWLLFAEEAAVCDEKAMMSVQKPVASETVTVLLAENALLKEQLRVLQNSHEALSSAVRYLSQRPSDAVNPSGLRELCKQQ